MVCNLEEDFVFNFKRITIIIGPFKTSSTAQRLVVELNKGISKCKLHDGAAGLVVPLERCYLMLVLSD